MENQVAILERNCDYSDYDDLTFLKDGGVLKKVIQEGNSGDYPYYGDQVFVDFIGIFEENGEVFDSSREKGKQFSFQFGTGEVIPAWDICIATMKRGEICQLFCRSDYAYGKKENLLTVPPNTNLIFEIELHDWCGQDLTENKDKGIVRRILQSGSGDANPNKGGSVTVSLKGMVNRVIFDAREQIEFRLTEGSNHNIPIGIEIALEHFKKDEKSLVQIHPKYMGGTTNHEAFVVKDSKYTVEYEVHLHDFLRTTESWELDTPQRIDNAIRYKKEGNTFFKERKYDIAVHKYEEMLHLLQYTEVSLEESKKVEVLNLRVSGRINLAMSYIKLGSYLLAKDNAEQAIALDPVNVKAYFQLGQACLLWGEAAKAIEAFQKCVELEPDNKAALKQVNISKEVLKKQEQKEKSIYGGMFDKFADNDAKALARLNKRDVMAEDLGEWEEGTSPEPESTSDIAVRTQDELKAVDMIYI